MKANQSTEKEIRENIKDLFETTDKYGLVIYPVSCMNEKLEYIKKRSFFYKFSGAFSHIFFNSVFHFGCYD